MHQLVANKGLMVHKNDYNVQPQVHQIKAAPYVAPRICNSKSRTRKAGEFENYIKNISTGVYTQRAVLHFPAQHGRIIDAPVIMILSMVKCLDLIRNMGLKCGVTISDAALSGIGLRQLAVALALGQDSC